MSKRRELYKRISSKTGKGVKIKSSLCFYNPKEVYKAVTQNRDVVRWLRFISNHYLPPLSKEVLLIFPCSREKPYHRSRSYKILLRTLSMLSDRRDNIHLMTISEPFGLVPEEFYGNTSKWHDWQNSWYDCPGLFEWWCNKYNQPYSKEYAEKCISLLASRIALFFRRIKLKRQYSKIIAFVRTYSSQLKKKDDHTHRRIIELAAKISEVNVKVLPPRKIVSKIVRMNGHFAWDMYGVAHPEAQKYLLNYLNGVLNGKN